MKIRTRLARIKRRVLKKPLLKDRRFPPFWFNEVLGKKSAFCVQIGSNDGKTGDPLNLLFWKNEKWKGLFVEPVPYSFKKLAQNYTDTDRFKLENVAINDGSIADFYFVRQEAKKDLPNLPYWYDQLASFKKDHITKELEGVLEPYITSLEIEGVTLKNLLDRNGVETIDLLHIDTEGYDWEILKQLDLQKFRPQFILFEWHHLNPNDMQSAYNFLKGNYHLFKSGIDMLAVLRNGNETKISSMKQYMQTYIL